MPAIKLLQKVGAGGRIELTNLPFPEGQQVEITIQLLLGSSETCRGGEANAPPRCPGLAADCPELSRRRADTFDA